MDMYKSFEKFGVEVYKKNELFYTRIFDTLIEAVKFAKNRYLLEKNDYSCKFISTDKYGNKIQEL